MADGVSYYSSAPPEWESYLPDYHHEVLPTKPSRMEKNAPILIDESEGFHDLSMDFVAEQQKKSKMKNIRIKHHEKVDNFVVYKIEVFMEESHWIVSRRYREFHFLHERLVQSHGIAWELLPPKKILGNLRQSNVEKRKTSLEKYLQSVILEFQEFPRVLIEFLEIDQFDVHGVCRQLARDLYEIGDDLLRKRSIFKITPLQMHCINRRLQLPMPTCDNDDPKEDIGHLYSFLHQVKRVLIYPGNEDNLHVKDNNLSYDISIFKTLRYLEVVKTDIELIEGIELVQEHISEVRAHRCIKLLKDFLIGSESWTQGLLMTVNAGKEEHTDVVDQFKKWKNLKKASFSYNELHSIDYSITLLPNITVLDLSHNLLTDVQYLEELTFLTELNLSYNSIRHLGEFPCRIPSLSKLYLAGNGIQNITGLERLYSLQMLDLSNNKLLDVDNVLIICNLPMLDEFNLRGNPLVEQNNYRLRLFVQFGNRASEVKLDGLTCTKREMIKVRELVKSRENYEVINNEFIDHPSKDEEKPPKKAHLTSQLSATKSSRSPRIKKKDRVVDIQPNLETNITGVPAKPEKEQAMFREQIEQLRQDAGENWLSYYNDMVVKDGPHGKNSSTYAALKQEDNESAKIPDPSESKNETEGVVVGKVNGDQENRTENGNTTPAFIQLLAMEEIDLELTDEMRSSVKEIIKRKQDLSKDTFLATRPNVSHSNKFEEFMVAVDTENNTLIEIDLETGHTISGYSLGVLVLILMAIQ